MPSRAVLCNRLALTLLPRHGLQQRPAGGPADKPNAILARHRSNPVHAADNAIKPSRFCLEPVGHYLFIALLFISAVHQSIQDFLSADATRR
jgi:hypothetical protein